MGMVVPRRATYRVRQFVHAVRSYFGRPDPQQWLMIEAVLPPPAQVLYREMPRPDQRHALRVVATLRGRGLEQRALLQAALLHDAAKHLGGVMLPHRVGAVLVKAFRPALWQQWVAAEQLPRSKFWRPFWTLAHHAELGARLAVDAGCEPLAAALIAHHQDGTARDEHEAELLAALRAADDDN